MKGCSVDPAGALIGTILHEATHNLGPTDVYADVQGQEARGGLRRRSGDSMLEELKAETGAMYYLDWLRAKGLVTLEQQQRGVRRVDELGDASHRHGRPLGRWRRGVLAAVGHPGGLRDGRRRGHLSTPPRRTRTAPTGGPSPSTTTSCPRRSRRCSKAVGTIKAGKGDKAGAQALVAKYVEWAHGADGPGLRARPAFPWSTLVYAVER